MNLKLTKQAEKKLRKINKSDNKTAKRIKQAIFSIRDGEVSGESLKGYTNFKKYRVGKYRLIYTTVDNELWITIIEKRETVYLTFKHLFEKSDFLK